MTAFGMIRHALAHLGGGWVVTQATNTKLSLAFIGPVLAPLEPPIPGMSVKTRPDGRVIARLADGRLIGVSKSTLHEPPRPADVGAAR